MSTAAQNDRSQQFTNQGNQQSQAGVQEQAKQTGSKLADAAQQIGGQAREAASSLASEATQRIQGYADQQMMAGADLVGGVAGAIRAAADELGRTSPALAGFVRGAADNVQSMSHQMRNKSAEELLADARDVVRNRPALVFGAAAGLGFLAFRLLNGGIAQAATELPRSRSMARSRSMESESPLQPFDQPFGATREPFVPSQPAGQFHGR